MFLRGEGREEMMGVWYFMGGMISSAIAQETHIAHFSHVLSVLLSSLGLGVVTRPQRQNCYIT